jgi:hypothetical protein
VTFGHKRYKSTKIQPETIIMAAKVGWNLLPIYRHFLPIFLGFKMASPEGHFTKEGKLFHQL